MKCSKYRVFFSNFKTALSSSSAAANFQMLYTWSWLCRNVQELRFPAWQVRLYLQIQRVWRMDMQCTFLSALIYKKPIIRGIAALFTNRKRLQQALCVLFPVCIPRHTVLFNFHTVLGARQENCIILSGVIGISVSLLSWSYHSMCVFVPACLSLCFLLPCCSFSLKCHCSN